MKIKNALVIGAVALGAYQAGVLVTYAKVLKIMMDEWHNINNNCYRPRYRSYKDFYAKH